MRRILAVALITTMVTGCATGSSSRDAFIEADKIRRLEMDVRLEKARELDRKIQDINHRHRVEQRIADEQDKKSLREKGYVVCEKYSTYSACK